MCTDKSFAEFARVYVKAELDQAAAARALEIASLYYRDQVKPGMRRTYGAQWRDALRIAWMRASYPSALNEVSDTLQRIRNTRQDLLSTFKASWES